jgi:thiol-disulfide isomerase/thioredoxin
MSRTATLALFALLIVSPVAWAEDEAADAGETEPAAGSTPDADEAIWPEPNKVVFQGDEGWDEFKKENPVMFAFFYAPWCGHCKTFKPELAELSRKTKAMPLVAIDCTQAKETCEKYGIKSYPRIQTFTSADDKDGTRYDGTRTAVDLKVYLENLAETLTRKQAGGDVKLTEKELRKLRIRALKRMLKERGQACKGCTDKEEFVQKVLKTQHKKKKETKKGSGRSFMEEKRYVAAKKVADEGWEDNGKVVHVIDDGWAEFRKSDKPSLVMFYAPWCGHCKTMKPEYAKFSAHAEFEGKVNIAAVECETNPLTCGKFDGGIESFPTLKYFTGPDDRKNMQDVKAIRTEDELVSFLESKLGGKASSGSLDGNWDKNHAGKVVHLGDANYAELRKENPQMMVFFYAPKCAGCKKLMSGYAEASNGVDGVVPLVAVDCSTSSESCKKFGVGAKLRNPIVKYFDTAEDKGTAFKKRKAKDIIDFITEKEEPDDGEL